MYISPKSPHPVELLINYYPLSSRSPQYITLCLFSSFMYSTSLAETLTNAQSSPHTSLCLRNASQGGLFCSITLSYRLIVWKAVLLLLLRLRRRGWRWGEEQRRGQGGHHGGGELGPHGRQALSSHVWLGRWDLVWCPGTWSWPEIIRKNNYRTGFSII